LGALFVNFYNCALVDLNLANSAFLAAIASSVSSWFKSSTLLVLKSLGFRQQLERFEFASSWSKDCV